MKKFTCLCLVLLFVLGATTAFAQSGSMLTIAASAGWIRDIDKQLAEQFTEESGIKVEFQLTPDDQYTNVLKTKLSTGEGPDIFLTQSGVGMNEFQPEKNYLDLSQEPWVERLTDWAKNGTTYDGKVLAMNLWSADGWALLYDPAKFEKAGVESVPNSYQSFTEACDKLTAAGYVPLYSSGTAVWYQTMWLDAASGTAAATDPDYLKKLNDNTLKFAEIPAFELALTQLKDLVDRGYFGEDYMSTTWEDSVSAMASGEYAMIMVYTTYPNEVMALDAGTNAVEWEMFPVPLADNTAFALSAGGIVHAINKNSGNIDAAKQYLNFRARLDNVEAYYKQRPDLGEASMKDYQGLVTKAYNSCVENATSVVANLETGIQFFNAGALGKYFQEMYMGTKTPMQVLEAIDAERQKMFDAVS